MESRSIAVNVADNLSFGQSDGSNVVQTRQETANMIDYDVRRIPAKIAKEYIRANHYSHGCHNGPSPCYGLYDGDALIGVIMFAVPCSEAVCSSVFGPDYKRNVIELHRLHILDVTPKNAESWFISRAFKLLRKERSDVFGILSFSDTTQGHTGVIYKATNAYSIGTTGKKSTFYLDKSGRLRHPRQCGKNITRSAAAELGWTPVVRGLKNRYLWVLPTNKKFRKKLVSICKYKLLCDAGK